MREEEKLVSEELEAENLESEELELLDDLEEDDVLAWMPLPKPYEEEEKQ